MLLKQTIRPLKLALLLSLLFVANLTLKSQSKGDGDMTQFYVVSIVFVVLIVGGVMSFFVSNKKKKD
jgi:cell division protein FtsW (lipid II flippase)